MLIYIKFLPSMENLRQYFIVLMPLALQSETMGRKTRDMNRL